MVWNRIAIYQSNYKTVPSYNTINRRYTVLLIVRKRRRELIHPGSILDKRTEFRFPPIKFYISSKYLLPPQRRLRRFLGVTLLTHARPPARPFHSHRKAADMPALLRLSVRAKRCASSASVGTPEHTASREYVEKDAAENTVATVWCAESGVAAEPMHMVCASWSCWAHESAASTAYM